MSDDLSCYFNLHWLRCLICYCHTEFVFMLRLLLSDTYLHVCKLELRNRYSTWEQ